MRYIVEKVVIAMAVGLDEQLVRLTRGMRWAKTKVGK